MGTRFASFGISTMLVGAVSAHAPATLACAGDACAEATHSCYVEGTPGCNDAHCCPIVCALDPFCCDAAWDAICVNEALQFCVSGGCPPSCLGTPENEPCGFDGNGGCNSEVPSFMPVSPGDEICGTAWADGGMRDTDWFAITLEAPTTITLTCASEMPMVFGFVDTNDCATASEISPSASSDLCTSATVTHCVPAGTWWLFAAPAGFNAFPCGVSSQYTLSIESGPACGVPVCGDGICGEGEDLVNCPWDCDLVAGCGNDGPCEVPHDAPGCDDILCCAGVCIADPFCCTVSWDQICVDQTATHCAPAAAPCPAVCDGDLGGDGLVSGADITQLLGNWQTSNPCSDLDGNGVVNGGDIAALLGGWGPCPVVASPGGVGFGQARVGESNVEAINIVNPSPFPAAVVGATISSPAFTILESVPGFIPPGESVPLIVQFAPTRTGIHDDAIILHLANGQDLLVDAFGEGIPDLDSPPDEWLDVSASLVSVSVDADLSILYHYALEANPKSPVSLKHQVATKHLVGEGAPSAEVLIAVPSMPYRSFAPFPVILKTPSGGPLPGTRVKIFVEVKDPSGETVHVVEVKIFVPPPPPPAPPCPCTPPTVLKEHDNVAAYFPDSPLDLVNNPPAGQAVDRTYDPTPGASPNKVALVRARLEGPTPGMCCFGPESLFRIHVDISSVFKWPIINPPSGPNYGVEINKWHTGHALIRSCRGVEGMSIFAFTGDRVHFFQSTPQSAFGCPGLNELPKWGTEIGRIELTTSWDLPIWCVPMQPWPCVSKAGKQVTEVSFNGDNANPAQVPGSGGINVHWEIAYASFQCLLNPVVGKIHRLIFIRGDDVYSPQFHGAGWLHWNGDEDGDGVTNEAEMVAGTNPKGP